MKQIKVSAFPEKEDDDDLLLDVPRESGPQTMTLSSGSWEIHRDKILACISLIANEVPDRMYSGKDVAKLLNSGYSVIPWFYDSILFLSGSAETFPLPDAAEDIHLFPTDWVAQWSQLECIECRGQNSVSVLGNTVTSLCWTPIPLQITLRHISVFSPLLSAPPCLPEVQFVAEQSLHTEIQSRWWLPAHRTPYNVSHAAGSHLFLYQLFPPSRAWNMN